jgi:hypothetical protein
LYHSTAKHSPTIRNIVGLCLVLNWGLCCIFGARFRVTAAKTSHSEKATLFYQWKVKQHDSKLAQLKLVLSKCA